MYVCMYVYMYVYVCVCICVYVCTYVCTCVMMHSRTVLCQRTEGITRSSLGAGYGSGIARMPRHLLVGWSVCVGNAM